MQVSQIMSKDFIVVDPDVEISQIAQLLTENSDSSILVMNKDGSIGGIITQTDLLYKDIEPDSPLFIEFLGGIIYVQNVKTYQNELRKLLSIRAKEFMTSHVYTITPNDSIEKAAKFMVEKKIGHLPVIQDGKTIGMIKKSDIIKYVRDLIIKGAQ